MTRAGVALAASLLAAAGVYRAGPPPGHTGAFGEPDCGECHFDAVREDPAGAVEIRAPARFRPGGTYEIGVAVRHPDLRAAGFQMTTRFLDGDPAGGQAGRLEATPGTRLQNADDGIAYLSHSGPGAAPDEPGRAVWTARWTAPEDGTGPIAFDVAAQAANDDDSEFGERLYLLRTVARPCPSPPRGSAFVGEAAVRTAGSGSRADGICQR